MTGPAGVVPRSPAVPPVPPMRRIDLDATWRALQRAASDPYRRAGRFAWHFAHGKLGRDPVFRSLLEQGELPPQARVLDIGCGQGLLASLLRAVDAFETWPEAWPAPPRAASYTGIELMARDVERARAALGTDRTRFVCTDMRDAELPASDVAVLLDVLHYVERDAQEALLVRVARSLAPRGRLLLRVGDMAHRRGYAASQWVDRLVARIRGHRVAPTYGRTLAEWDALLGRLGFRVRSVPMSRGTPFANVLLIADLDAR